MFNTSSNDIVSFVLFIVILIVSLCTFIVAIVYLYQKKQLAHFKEIEQLKEDHRQALVQSQVEIQEQTFRNITKDIHRNISNKISVAKVSLNSLHGKNMEQIKATVRESISLLSAGMTDLRDLARSMSSEIITTSGLIKGLEFEVEQLSKSNRYKVSFLVKGNPVFLTGHQELILFRIAQEATSNITRHSHANKVDICLHYTLNDVKLSIRDNGVGFNQSNYTNGSGLIGIQKRAKLLHGHFKASTDDGANLLIQITINTPN
jgi:two-component system, NarL family, sensor kinase